MPVTVQNNTKAEQLYQRVQYRKGGIGRFYWDFRDKMIFRAIPETAQSILDAGCGEGITLEKLIRVFPKKDIKGIDLLEENVGICRQHGLPVSRGDLTHMELPDSSIDCCILSEVIEHVENYRDVFHELWRVLKPDGRLIVVFPNDRIFKIARLLTLKFREAFYDPGHVRQWSPKSINHVLAGLGYTVLRTTSIPVAFWPFSLHGIAIAVK